MLLEVVAIIPLHQLPKKTEPYRKGLLRVLAVSAFNSIRQSRRVCPSGCGLRWGRPEYAGHGLNITRALPLERSKARDPAFRCNQIDRG